jgi:succinate dehydrogenase hydrophobic membrane anchor protein
MAVATAARLVLLPAILADQRAIVRRSTIIRTHARFDEQSREHIAVIDAIADQDPEAARAAIGAPLGALVVLLTLTAAFYHMRLGLQVVIEDYITKPVTRAGLLIVNTLVTAGLWLTALYSILLIAA